jgi:hypothetical protein
MKYKTFIWTEVFNCGEIINPMLQSFLAHHSVPIHVYGTKKDLNLIETKSPLVIPIALSSDTTHGISTEDWILNGYKDGHKGTSRLWEHLIQTRKEEIFVHIDADTIFVGESISNLIDSIHDENYAIAGSRRAYQKRGYRKEGIDSKLLDLRPDSINTDCFAFNKNYISKFPRFFLQRKILGRRVSILPIVDFFDPVTFGIIRKSKGKVKYMDSPNDGIHSTLNLQSRFMQTRITFSAVGSGCNFFHNGFNKIPDGYSQFALQSYSLFASQFLGKDIGIKHLNDSELMAKLNNLDKIKWVLS